MIAYRSTPPSLNPMVPIAYRSDIRFAVERALKTHDIAPSRFGRLAVGDPLLVSQIRQGRRLRPRTEAKVRAFIQSLDK